MDPFYSDGSQGVSLMHSSSSPRKSEKKKKCCCDCESRSIQTYIMIIANAFFLLAGILLIVVGCLSLAHRDYYGNFLSGATYGFVTWTLVFVGVFVVIVSLFGLYAAFKEGKLLLKVRINRKTTASIRAKPRMFLTAYQLVSTSLTLMKY